RSSHCNRQRRKSYEKADAVPDCCFACGEHLRRAGPAHCAGRLQRGQFLFAADGETREEAEEAKNEERRVRSDGRAGRRRQPVTARPLGRMEGPNDEEPASSGLFSFDALRAHSMRRRSIKRRLRLLHTPAVAENHSPQTISAFSLCAARSMSRNGYARCASPGGISWCSWPS